MNIILRSSTILQVQVKDTQSTRVKMDKQEKSTCFKPFQTNTQVTAILSFKSLQQKYPFKYSYAGPQAWAFYTAVNFLVSYFKKFSGPPTTSQPDHYQANRSQHHSAASLIRPIWRIFKGLEAADMVS
jgi:hypothetical protein